MDVRVGVTHTPKELHVELTDDTDQGAVIADVEAALASQDGVLWLTDRKGRRIGVPAAKVAYVEIGSPNEERRVGFSSRA
jgi:hypothetical protein